MAGHQEFTVTHETYVIDPSDSPAFAVLDDQSFQIRFEDTAQRRVLRIILAPSLLDDLLDAVSAAAGHESGSPRIPL